jgi:phosphoglycerate dehydrogenase-like enzyme
MTRLLIFEPSYRRLESRLAAFGDGLECVLMQPDGAMTLNGAPLAGPADPEIGWFNSELYFNPPRARDYAAALLGSATLKWVQSSAAGYDERVFVLLSKKARLTTNHSQAIGMAEYVLSTVLDHMQGGASRRRDQADHRWNLAPYREVMGTEWLIVGFGAIGQETARRARAFGARITGVRRSLGDDPLADVMATPDQLPDLLPKADVVVLSLPLNRHTEGMVDAAFLAAMNPASIFVNVGRGGLVDEDALLAALDSGKPEHAILDVVRTEPLPSESPIWEHPRVALTSHCSGIGSGVAARTDALFLENVRRYLAGEALLNEVDAKEVAGD